MSHILNNIKQHLSITLMIILLFMNGALLFNKLRGQDLVAVWQGPLMPGKRYVLPDRIPTAMAKVQEAEVPIKKVFSEEKKVDPFNEAGYVVQVGSFIYENAAEALQERLKNNGLIAHSLNRTEVVQLNQIQAGPFESYVQAKEAEIKLLAGGMDEIKMERSAEGYVLSLGRSYLLGYAIYELEKAKALSVSPLRILKVSAELPVLKVFLGPFPTKDQAKSMSVRVEESGMSVPEIKAWPYSNDKG
ncbi:MAG: SPOR domain-containing protein [Magnetococcus sp. DMHC-6]